MLVVYTLWGASPWVTTELMSPGDFVVGLGMLTFIASSLLSLLMSSFEVYTSGPMIQQVADVLNWSIAKEHVPKGHAAMERHALVAWAEGHIASTPAFTLQQPSYAAPLTVHNANSFKKEELIFDRLAVFYEDVQTQQQVLLEQGHLPPWGAGGLLELRTEAEKDSSAHFVERASLTLMQMLSGALPASEGVRNLTAKLAPLPLDDTAERSVYGPLFL
jgi:hypothetical protein